MSDRAPAVFYPPLAVRRMSLSTGWHIRALPPGEGPGPLRSALPDPPVASVSLPFAWQRIPGWETLQGPVELTLDFPDPPWHGRTDLVAEGAFYVAEWELNGMPLGRHEGYIAPFRRDVTDVLALGGSGAPSAPPGQNPPPHRHHLRVWLDCPPEPEHLQKERMTGIFSHWDCLPSTYNPGGLWRQVRLELHRPVRVDGLWLRTVRLTAREAFTEVRGRVWADSGGLYVITARLRPLPGAPRRPPVATTVTLAVPPGQSELLLPLAVPRPLLWEPRAWLPDGRPPYRYELQVIVEPADPGGNTAEAPGVPRAAAPARFVRHVGVRTVERLPDGRLCVNGRPLFVRGMNYGPSSAYLAETRPERIRKDVTDALAAGLNALRVHAHLDRPALYRIADREGLLLFQDGPLQWMYKASALAAAPAHLLPLLDRVLSHPSVVYLAVHNEPVAVANPAEPDRAAHLRAFASVFLWSENRDLWDRALARDLRRRVQGQLIVSSQSGVLPRLPGADVHLYMGWYGDFGPLGNLDRLARLAPWTLNWVTEFGAQSLPAHATSRRFLPPQPSAADWERAARTHLAQVPLLEAHIGIMGRSLAEAVRRTQLYQATLDTVYIDRLRAAKYAPVAGFFAFLWADAALGVTWSHLDVDRVPKRALDALREACAPVVAVLRLPLAAPRPGHLVRVPLDVVNDTAWPLAVTVRLEAERVAHGTVATQPSKAAQIKPFVFEVHVPPDARVAVADVPLPADLLRTPHRLHCTWSARPTGSPTYRSSPPPEAGARTYVLPWPVWGRAWVDPAVEAAFEGDPQGTAWATAASEPVPP